MLRVSLTLIACLSGVLIHVPRTHAHGPFSHTHAPPQNSNQPISSQPNRAPEFSNQTTASQHLTLLSWILRNWPTPNQDEIIALAYEDHRAAHDLPDALPPEKLAKKRTNFWSAMKDRLQVIELMHDGETLSPTGQTPVIQRSNVIAMIQNTSAAPLRIQLTLGYGFGLPDSRLPPAIRLAPGEQLPFPLMVNQNAGLKSRLTSCPIKCEATTLDGDQPRTSHETTLELPIEFLRPATLRLRCLTPDRTSYAAMRLMVVPADNVCRFGHSANAPELNSLRDLAEDPVIYPPLGIVRSIPYFYGVGEVTVSIPPGPVRVIAEQGYAHRRTTRLLHCDEGETYEIDLTCPPLVDLTTRGWISGDTHVHWVKDTWNVDLPLYPLALVQQAEDLRVVNNLTLLQRRANEAFIKPSQKPMGPIWPTKNQPTDPHSFFAQMGEEYRNEDLYGHLCFLNLQWLVQPIGTGPIIAGPDALDYPLNRTAIEQCREQGGISIEAHGTAGNKDVPANVVHGLTDAFDQLEPEMYYRFLDCGFQIPLTNGSDFPARQLGAARAFVRMPPAGGYADWVEGVRRGRTFTSSGPLLFLKVNGHDLGDVIDANANTTLNIELEAISRDPLGVVQIISNGVCIAERKTDETQLQMNLSIPAGESRWIVARCSRRSDGDASIGWGNFNAILGPGIAHTSPVYVAVDGLPRFHPPAAEFWITQLRQHRRDIETKGRFSSPRQLSEATSYVDQSIQMYGDLATQIAAARSSHERPSEQRLRLANVLRRFLATTTRDQALAKLTAAETRFEVDHALAPLTLGSVTINPESRVKLNANLPKLKLRQGRPQRFLLRVENVAGITAPLRITPIDLAAAPPQTASWCSLRTVDSPFTSRFLTGAESEYKVVEITVHEPGLRELRLVGDAGQGTQDLGFRATADILIDTQAPRWAQ